MLVHAHVWPSLVRVSSGGMWFVVCATSCTMHISGHCLLKTFIFCCLNMLTAAPLSFEATWHPLHPTAAKSGFLSVCLLLSLVGERREWKKAKTCKLALVSSHQAFCVPNKSTLQYLLFQGIIRFYRDYPACSNTPPWESRSLTHTRTQNHTQGHRL